MAWSLALTAILLSLAIPGGAQSPRGPGGERGTSPSRGGAPTGHHGTPRGWRFAWPPGGDPAKGREVFAQLECYSCHEVRGENFPAPTEVSRVGPELSAMGPLHDEAYFAEAIINPRAVIEKGRGYAGPDGSSKMPSFNDSLTVQDVTDLVAYLRQLRPPAKAPSGRGAPSGEHKH
jgi:mono/diheme cytochrome c family protein